MFSSGTWECQMKEFSCSAKSRNVYIFSFMLGTQDDKSDTALTVRKPRKRRFKKRCISCYTLTHALITSYKFYRKVSKKAYPNTANTASAAKLVGFQQPALQI